MSSVESEHATAEDLAAQSDKGALLRLFGSMVLELDGESISRFPTKRCAALLGRLAIAREMRIGRDELAELLWPDEHLDQTRSRLRQELVRLRQALGSFGRHIVADRHWVEVEPGSLTTDVSLFDGAMDRASALPSPEGYLTDAVSWLTGQFMAGHQDAWAQATRRSYMEKARFAWLALADAREASGNPKGALEAVGSAVKYDPLDTAANSILIRKLVDQGQVAAAHKALEAFDAALFRELRQRAPEGVRSILTTGSSSSDSPIQVRGRVARPLSIYGRDELLATIEGAISRRGSAVTLVGLAGSGKTHLLREIAWRFSQRQPLPVQFGGEPPKTSDGLYVVDVAMDRATLVSLIEAASNSGWRVLLESRTRLGLEGCEEILVGNLAVPRPDDVPEALLSNPSIQLLNFESAKAGTHPPDAAELARCAEIANRLEGYPLALKYFAGRLVHEPSDRLLAHWPFEFETFLKEQKVEGGSLRQALFDAASELPDEARGALYSLAFLDGASADLFNAVLINFNLSATSLLDNRCLVTTQNLGGRRRLRVPRAVVDAVLAGLTEEERNAVALRTWKIVADWSFETSRRLKGDVQDLLYSELFSEIENLRQGIRWSLDKDPALAAYSVVGMWRTVCSRGQPHQDADLLFAAAEAGADNLPPPLGGEAWLGAAITLSIAKKIDEAERAFLKSIRNYESDDSSALRGKLSGAWLNYAVNVVAVTDKWRAIEYLRKAIELAVTMEAKTLCQIECAQLLAIVGVTDDAIQVAEEAFAFRTQLNDPTMNSRAYADLGALYHRVGRTEAARPLILEGIRRLRDAGIKYMLLDYLIFLARVVVEDPELDRRLALDLLREASELAEYTGGIGVSLDVAGIWVVYYTRCGQVEQLPDAIDRLFHLTQSAGSEKDRVHSLRLLRDSLMKLGYLPFANAICSALGEPFDGPLHSGWASLLRTQSHGTLCVLAPVMAKEALAREVESNEMAM